MSMFPYIVSPASLSHYNSPTQNVITWVHVSNAFTNVTEHLITHHCYISLICTSFQYKCVFTTNIKMITLTIFKVKSHILLYFRISVTPPSPHPLKLSKEKCHKQLDIFHILNRIHITCSYMLLCISHYV